LGVLVEVRLGGGLDAVRTPSEVDDVQVRGDDLLFGLLVVHLERLRQLGPFTGERRGVVLRGLLDVLLRNGRTTAGATRDLVVDRAQDAGEVEARVRLERRVLGRVHRVFDG